MSWYNFFKYSVLVLFRILFRVRSIDQEKYVPQSGAFILASNHQSWFDPPIVGILCRRELHFFAKKELFKNPLLRFAVTKCNSMPVRRSGFDREAIQKATEVLRSGHPLVMFPEGTRDDGETFLRPKPGIGKVAVDSGVQIVPAFVHLSNHLRHSFLTRTPVTLTFGEPIPADSVKSYENTREGHTRLAEEVMARIGKIRDAVIGNKKAKDKNSHAPVIAGHETTDKEK